MNRTKLMNKLFSDSTPEEFKESIADKIEEALATGSSELTDGEQSYTFTDDGDAVTVKDEVTEEVTKFTENPENPEDIQMEAVEEETPKVDEPKEETPTKDEEVEVTITGDKTYSIKLKNFSDASKMAGVITAVRKSFSEGTEVDPEEEGKEEPKEEPKEDTQVKSDTTPEAEKAITDAVEKLEKTVAELKETKDKATAEEVKTECDKVMTEIESLENEEKTFSDLKNRVKLASEETAKVLDETPASTDPKEEPKEEVKETPAIEPTSMKVLLGKGDDDDDDIKVNPNESKEDKKVFSSLESRGESVNPYLDIQF